MPDDDPFRGICQIVRGDVRHGHRQKRWVASGHRPRGRPDDGECGRLRSAGMIRNQDRMFIRRLQGTALFVGCCAALTACGTKAEDTAPPLEQECSPYPVPEDAPTETIIAAGGRGYICYLPAPDGLCIAVDGAEAAGVVAAGGPEAAGCEDGVLQIDGSCPTDLQVGQCALPRPARSGPGTATGGPILGRWPKGAGRRVEPEPSVVMSRWLAVPSAVCRPGPVRPSHKTSSMRRRRWW